MRRLLRLFFTAEGLNPWLVILCLLASSVVESLGLASLVPLLSLATENDAAVSSSAFTTTREALERIGIPMELRPLVIVLVATLILKSVFRMWALRYVGNAVADLETSLRANLIRNLFQARWSYLVHSSMGRFVAGVSGMAGKAAQAYQLVAQFIAQSIQTLAYLGVALFVSWPLALGAIGLGAGMGIGLSFLVRMSRRAGIRHTARNRELVAFLIDALSNIKPLRAMAKQSSFTRMMDRQIASLRKAVRKQVLAEEALRNGQEAVVALVLGIGFLVAVERFQVPVVEIAVVGLLLSRATNGIAKMQGAYQRAVVVEAPYFELQEMIEDSASAPEPNPGSKQASFEVACVFDGVDFAYEERAVLRSLSMEIPAGRITVLTGPSGAGKTTIADLLLGLHQPTGGALRIDGVPLTEIDLQSWRRQVGYVPQEVVLFHDTLLANVTLGDPAITEQDVRDALELAGAAEFVRELPEGLETIVGEHGARLSGGQRQRIALARALVGRPRLMVLDEVTSALDPESEIAILRRIQALEGAAVFAITHRPAFLDIADRIYQLDDGQVREAPTLLAASGGA
jgi:ATP-binding cassette subfamily C protein